MKIKNSEIFKIFYINRISIGIIISTPELEHFVLFFYFFSIARYPLKIIGRSLDIKADKNQREGCGCIGGIAYNTCMKGCVYCYANDSQTTTAPRHASHDLESELLIGSVLDGEKITDRKAP